MARRRCRRWRGRCSTPGTTSTSPDGTSPRISNWCAASHRPCWARYSLSWPSGWTFGSSCGRERRFRRSIRRDPRSATGSATSCAGTRIHCEPDPREHPFHCHHEKTIVIDGTVAFVGGIDMTDDCRRPLRLTGASGPPPARVARRRSSVGRSGRGRCRRALQHALAGAERRAPCRRRGAGVNRRADRSSGPDDRRGHVRQRPPRGLQRFSRAIRARFAQPGI